ncbi:MAG: nuclear transport factor 2 family protein [Arenibacterium sp.]
MSVQSEIEALFTAYLTAWNARDFSAMAAFFSEPTVYFFPDGPHPIKDHAALIKTFETVFERLEAEGFSHTEIATVSARQCNDTLAIVDLKNVARLRTDGSAIDVLDAVYVCTLKDGRWQLSTAIGCWPDWRNREPE